MAGKSKSFNLIKKEVEVNQTVKVERDWYILFNLLFVCLIVAASVMAIMFKVYIKSNLNEKSAKLAAKLNNELNTSYKSFIRSELSVVNSKFEIYQDFYDQNFDLNTFYNQMTSVYPGIKIDKFSEQPNSANIDVDVRIDTNGYTDLPKFILALESNDRFQGTSIKGVTFSIAQASSTTSPKTMAEAVSDPTKIITQVSLSVPKNAIMAEPETDQ